MIEWTNYHQFVCATLKMKAPGNSYLFAILPATAAKAKTNAWSATVAVSIARFAIAIARFDVTTPPISVRVSVIPPLHITGAAGAITAPIFIADEPDVFS